MWLHHEGPDAGPVQRHVLPRGKANDLRHIGTRVHECEPIAVGAHVNTLTEVVAADWRPDRRALLTLEDGPIPILLGSRPEKVRMRILEQEVIGEIPLE